jgi:hypothetical protein
MVLSPIALQLFRGTLFGVGPYDPVTILAVAILLVAVSIIAAMIPAVRAARLSSLR